MAKALPRPNQAGFTPLAALIGMAIVMISLWGFLQANSSLRSQDTRMDRRVQGEQLLASIAVDLQSMAMDDLLNLCSSSGAMYPATATPKCGQTGDTLSTTAQYNQATAVNRLGARFDLKPGNIMGGTSCVDLISCKWRGTNHILEVKLSGIFLVPPAKSVSFRQLVFRTTR